MIQNGEKYSRKKEKEKGKEMKRKILTSGLIALTLVV